MYEIKVLDSKEFDQLRDTDSRYSYVDESNLGFADRQKGVAYVRQTHLHELNKYLISHELEELEEEMSHHEDPNGIRHKKGPKIFKDLILPALKGFVTGGPLGAAQGAGGGFFDYQNRVAQNSSPGGGEQFQNSGSYSPLGQSGQSFGYGSPLSLFSGGYAPSTGRLPDVASGSYTPDNSLSSLLGNLSPEAQIQMGERRSGSEGRYAY